MNSQPEPSKDAPFPSRVSVGELRLRALFQDSENIFWVTNAQGLPLVTECQNWLDYTGQTAAELSADWSKALHPKTGNLLRRLGRRRLRAAQLFALNTACGAATATIATS